MKTKVRELNLWTHPAYTLTSNVGSMSNENGLMVFSTEGKAEKFAKKHGIDMPVLRHRDPAMVWALCNRNGEEYCEVDP